MKRRPMLPAPVLRCLPLLLLAACVTATPPRTPPPLATRTWSAPLPHAGKPAELARWWSQFDDPLLLELIEQGQRSNPNIEVAAARIREARANARARSAGLWPTLTGNAQQNRSSSPANIPSGVIDQWGVSADARWEVDLFGAQRHSADAAQARARSSEVQWHDARVSLAAEIASDYVNLRACEALVAVYEEDTASQKQSAELTARKVQAGFEAPANGALARASAADASARLIAQRADCDNTIKALVAVTGFDESALRTRLQPRTATLPIPAEFAIDSVPAAGLAQRPDLVAAQREVEATAAEVGAADAARYPQLTLTGSVGTASFTAVGTTLSGRTWAIGPALSLPLFDAGRRSAELDAARARYDVAVATWRQRAVDAVREVEQALVRLDAANRREADAENAARGYAEFFAAARDRWRVGTGSLLDVEEARRTSLNAQATLVQVRSDRIGAWIALYKAVGGGWQRRELGDARGG